MSRAPVVRQISWPAVLPQLAALGVATAIGVFLTRTTDGIFLGAAAYLTYSFCSRMFIARAHRRGMRYSVNEQYEPAIRAFVESYEFFARNSWIDRYRSVVMMSPSAVSYREMALCNIAFSYSQLGDGEKAESYYRRALDEFPESDVAPAALRMIESIRKQ